MQKYKNRTSSGQLNCQGPHVGDGEAVTDCENQAPSKYHSTNASKNTNGVQRTKIKSKLSKRGQVDTRGGKVYGIVHTFEDKMNISGCWFPYFRGGKDNEDQYNYKDVHSTFPCLSSEDQGRTNRSSSASLMEVLVSTKHHGRALQELLQCLICWDFLVEATTAGCGHTFCRRCLNDWTRKKRWCPICQKLIKIMIRNFNLDQIVEHFTPVLPIQSQERIKVAKQSSAEKTDKLILAPTVMTWIRHWLGSTFKKTESVGCTTEISNQRICSRVKGCIYKLWQFLTHNDEYHRMESPIFLVMSPTGLFCFGVLIGCFLAASSEFWSYLFHLFQRAVHYLDLNRYEEGKECSSLVRKEQ